MRHCKQALSALAVVSFITACSGGSSDSAGDGTISVSLMDRPVDGVTEVVVTVSGIWIKPRGEGQAIALLSPDSDAPITVNLLDLTADNPEVLVDQISIPAGSYNWIEMQIDDSGTNQAWVMTDGGGQEPLDVEVPSGRVRLVSGIEVGVNEGVHILFDWDVRKGLTHAVGRDIPYLLHPAFRILDATEIVKIEGTVFDSAVAAEAPGGAGSETCEPDDSLVVYVFNGMPADINDGVVEPTASADAADLNVGSDGRLYSVALVPGDYTVAFACEAEVDTEVIYLQPIPVAEADFATTAVVTVDFADPPAAP